MGELDTPSTAITADRPDDCPLGVREQTRNVLIVGLNTALCYLAAPVLYVDTVHTTLMNSLQQEDGGIARDWLSNLPSSAYMVLSILPLFVAWLFPQIRLLRRILVISYAVLFLSTALVVSVLLMPLPVWMKLAAVVAHGAVVGGARTVSVACEFEVLGVAVAESRRGQALGLAYGLGPILAIIGSLLSQLLLTGALGPIVVGAWAFPDNFAAVFASSLPVMALATFLCSRLVIPVPAHEASREPFLSGVFGGFGRFLGRRVVLLAVLSAILIFCGYQVVDNMTLYSGVLFKQDPAKTAGYQKAVLFTFKVVMGVTMGWVLTRSAPRAAVLISAVVGLTAVVFAIVAPASVFLLSFGLLGAGQLFGIYITNYILSCAPKALMRRYMAWTMITMMPAAPSGVIYGAVSDFFGSRFSKEFGYQMSFTVAATLIAVGIVLAMLLPRRPRPDG
jgi:MFS family permease